MFGDVYFTSRQPRVSESKTNRLSLPFLPSGYSWDEVCSICLATKLSHTQLLKIYVLHGLLTISDFSQC